MASRTTSRSTSSVHGRGASNSRPSRPYTGRSRPKTAATSTGYGENEIICAVTEGRGVPPTVGIAFVNVSTCEAVLCQFADTQTYARTCHKIKVFAPSEILYMTTAVDSNLVSTVSQQPDVHRHQTLMTPIDRRYWSDSAGHDYLQQLALPHDLESLNLALAGSFFAVCCFSAAMKNIELSLCISLAPHSLRIKFEPSEGSMMIDVGTIASLELIQNLEHPKSKECVYGLLHETLTPMGGRFLKSNILQPSTNADKISRQHEAIGELACKQEMFFSVRSALKNFVDTDRVLAALAVVPKNIDLAFMEQSVNNVLKLKTFVESIKPIWQTLSGSLSEDLRMIFEQCNPENYSEIEALINYALNSDVHYSTKPVELRNQRVHAIKAGVNSFLDVARMAYTEITGDVFELIERLKVEHNIALDLKFDSARQYYIRIPQSELTERDAPEIFINRFPRKSHLECQTLELVKLNQQIKDAHNEVVSLSDGSIQSLIESLRTIYHPLFKISEGIALLDTLAALAHVVIMHNYVRPELNSTRTIALKAASHPITSLVTRTPFIPNDIYATPNHRLQIITGTNMSGKSTYIRTVALLVILNQIGSFLPAKYASLPLIHQVSARISTDDVNVASVSTFSAEMREMAYILRNVTPHSLVIVDELGRGTSTTDGLSIAIAIAEALLESNAFVWFVTHFRELPRILAERAGVVNLHLQVDMEMSTDNVRESKMKMRYRIADGYEEEKFYGITLARAVGVPKDITDTAMQVSQMLHARNEAKRQNPRARAVARKRKLILNLRQQLEQARESEMEADDLRAWLQRLQDEFVVRMGAIEAEAEAGAPIASSSSQVIETDMMEVELEQEQEEEEGTRSDEAAESVDDTVEHSGRDQASAIILSSDDVPYDLERGDGVSEQTMLRADVDME